MHVCLPEIKTLCVFRFMVDSDVVGCCWIELPKGKYRVREEKSTGNTNSQSPEKVGVAYVLRTTQPLI